MIIYRSDLKCNVLYTNTKLGVFINNVCFWPTRDKELNNQRICYELHIYLHLCNIIQCKRFTSYYLLPQ